MPEQRPQEIDRLYAFPLQDFMKARDALAAELRAKGRAAEAADVGKLRKPTPAVWAINRVAREDPVAITRFVEAVDRLRRAHFGEPGPLAQATESQRSALETLVERAMAALADAGLRASAAVSSRISATLLGTAADPSARSDLRHGRLAHERPAPGFEALAGVAEPGSTRRQQEAPESGSTRKSPAPRRAQRAESGAEAALRAGESEVREARRRVEASERLAAQHGQAAEAAAREVEGLRQRLQEAERRAREARRAAQDASGAAERARRDAERVEARQQAAERTLKTARKRQSPKRPQSPC